MGKPGKKSGGQFSGTTMCKLTGPGRNQKKNKDRKRILDGCRIWVQRHRNQQKITVKRRVQNEQTYLFG